MIHSNKVILNRIRRLSHNCYVNIITKEGKLANPETGEIIDCTYDYGKELSAALHGLIRDGYLIKTDDYHVALTDKGLHPYAQKWEDIKHFLFYSIAVPIAVSIITSLLVLWLQGLLPAAQWKLL